MSAPDNTSTPGGVATPDTPGRPALSAAEKQRRANRPIRDKDPARNAAYWARIERIVDAAPPLSNEQRATIRAAFHQPAAAKEAA
jgi:hypothetical protein